MSVETVIAIIALAGTVVGWIVQAGKLRSDAAAAVSKAAAELVAPLTEQLKRARADLAEAMAQHEETMAQLVISNQKLAGALGRIACLEAEVDRLGRISCILREGCQYAPGNRTGDRPRIEREGD